MPQPARSANARRGRPGYDQSEVLAAAVRLFTRHGYDAASMGMLAEELGISKSGIYHHVPSKVELLRLALDDALTALEEAVAEASAHPGTPAQALEQLLRSTVGVLVGKQDEVRLLLRLRGNSEVETEAIRRRRAVDQHTAEMIAAAQESGELRDDVDPKVLARLMFGMINSTVEWHHPGHRSTEELAESAASVLLHGVAVSEAPSGSARSGNPQG